MSRREREVAELMLQGLSHTEIGDKLCIAASTVISHRKHIYAKLNISSKAALFVAAREKEKRGKAVR